MKLPREIGPIHFIGIGGIGMSGIAEVLINLGYTVQGSDASDSANVKRLREKGATIAIGHSTKALGNAAVVVMSTAIRRDNPELIAARAKRLPVVRRAEMLAELMRLKSCVAIAGTHGKTTTTSLVAALVDAGGFDPTVINGGIINAYGTNARLGAGDWMVVEADESDGTFLKLPADIAIVTNVDPEHLDHFKSFEAVQEAFRTFVENVPFYGFAVMCTDHPVVQLLVGQITDRRIITYGENPQADVRLLNLDHAAGRSRFSIVFRDRAGATRHQIDELALPMPGRHNALNATAAITVAHELRVGDDLIRKALGEFGGVRRRFTRTGEWNGVLIIDDYGHHPVEIAAVLRAARETSSGRVIAVVQPHRYTRLAALFEQFSTCFNDADTVIVAPVYPAGEAPISGADRDALVQGLRAHGHRQAVALDGPHDLARMIKRLAQSGDIVVCLGAGNITQWAYALPAELAALGAVA
jgi:UDP-N-acetylmuramate--alanine ligase